MSTRTGAFRRADADAHVYGTSCNCGCGVPPPRPGFGGIFSTLLNAAGSFVGDADLGNQIASKASPAFGPITSTPDQIATRVAPSVKAALASGSIDPAGISTLSQQIAAGVGPQVAKALAADGVYFPPGSVGAELQNPTPLDAFGGANAKWVLVGGLALGAALLFKAL